MLMLVLGQHLEHLGGDAWVGLHAGADQCDLGHLLVEVERREAQFRPCRPVSTVVDLGQIVLGGGEGDVGRAVRRDVLDDHVDVDVGAWPER